MTIINDVAIEDLRHRTLEVVKLFAALPSGLDSFKIAEVNPKWPHTLSQQNDEWRFSYAWSSYYKYSMI